MARLVLNKVLNRHCSIFRRLRRLSYRSEMYFFVLFLLLSTTVILQFTRTRTHRIGPRVFLAANFHNNADVIHCFQRETVELGKIIGTSNLFVSVYESGSKDKTQTILSQLRSTYRNLNISHEIVTDGISRRDNENRIVFLAKMRNQVLLPLYRLDKKFDFVVFVNDVFFRTDDILTLISMDVDMACGLDFTENDPNSLYSQHLKLPAKTLIFYDTWVSRTSQGMPFRNVAPYIHDIQIDDSILGKPFGMVSDILNMEQITNVNNQSIERVRCCWNGLVVLKSFPFYLGLSFRSKFPGECGASECSIFCDDMYSMGFREIFVHKGVKVAYQASHYSEILLLDSVNFQPKLNAEMVKFEMQKPLNTSVLCFGIAEGTDIEEQQWSRLSGESDSDFGYRIWSLISGEAHYPSGGGNAMINLVGGKNSISGSDVSHLKESINPDSPGQASILQRPYHLAKKVCLTGKDRKIPKLIHQIGRKKWQPKFEPYMTTWRFLHPDHNHAYYGDEEVLQIISDHLPPELGFFESLLELKCYGMFTDLARYVILFHYGGIYADLDTVATESLSCSTIDPEDSLVVGLESDFKNTEDAWEWGYARPKGYSLHTFALSKQNPIAYELMSTGISRAKYEIKERGDQICKTEDFSTINITGPGFFSDVIDVMKKQSKVRILPLCAFTGSHTEGDRFYAMMHQTSKKECLPKIHHFNSGTWFRGDQVVDQMITWGDGVLKKHGMESDS